MDFEIRLGIDWKCSLAVMYSRHIHCQSSKSGSLHRIVHQRAICFAFQMAWEYFEDGQLQHPASLNMTTYCFPIQLPLAIDHSTPTTCVSCIHL